MMQKLNCSLFSRNPKKIILGVWDYEFIPWSGQRYLSLHFVAGKVRERGIVGCFKASLDMVYGLEPRRGRHFIILLKFLISLFNFLFIRKPKKIILGVWDLKVIPWSVGDFLVFIETLSVLKLKHGADKVDVCVVCDSENPAGNRQSSNVNSSNFRYYLFNLLPIINTSPYLGSVFQFDSRSEFYSFLKQSINKYIIYPPINRQLREAFNYIGGAYFDDIQDFLREHGFVPHLAIDDYHLSWAYNFYRTEAKGLLPVAVALRNRPEAPGRNSEQDTWLGFFDLCKSAFPEVVFVVVGLREEVFEELRHRSNVIIAKDHGSTLADDFALIRTSLLYISGDSGIGSIAIFSDVPYLLFGWPPRVWTIMGPEPDCNFEFATQYQKLYPRSFIITPESLLEEFSNLYKQLDINKWRGKASAYKSTLYSSPLDKWL